VAHTADVLKARDGAGVVILGCAGMGAQRPALQAELGIPVIDPVQAAVAAAITALDLKYKG
jgi:Asp/Glu/hydantoin racemase